jgi:DNA-binding PadR family transcriptional regulator
MEEMDYLRCETRFVDGRRRKYYRATSVGRRALEEAREKLVELVAEVMEDRDEPFQQIRRRHRAETNSTHVHKRQVAKVTPRHSSKSHDGKRSRKSP